MSTDKRIQALEREAVAAHGRGDHWLEFWPVVAMKVRDIEPVDRERFHALADRLLGLLVAGDLDGRVPPGEPWEDDDQAAMPPPHDTKTAARLQPRVAQSLGMEVG